ncbi:MAG: hypothetical protein M1541_04385 [Acidobacteria bacterium]|nr:hypothetical protein [Acidobacteriota bacterium]
MRVRIQWGRIRGQSGTRRRVVISAFGHGLNLASVVALVLALWRLSNDLNWTNWFAISQGLFSHWQLWLALAILLQVAATILQRYSRGGGAAIS